MSHRLAPLMLTALLALTGCTGGVGPSATADPGDTQSLGDACATVADTVTDAITDFGVVDPADPAAMARALQHQIDPATALHPGDRIAAYGLEAMFDRWAALLDGIDPHCPRASDRLVPVLTHEQR